MNNNWPSNIKSVVLPNETGKEPVIPDGWELDSIILWDGSVLLTNDPQDVYWGLDWGLVSIKEYTLERIKQEKHASATENGVAGRKDDAGKPRIWEVMDGFKRALWAVARVGTWGGEVKYSDRPFDNWANVPDGYRRYSNSRERHYLASDGDINEESGMPHEWHAVWCALAALELKLREKDGE